MLLRVRLAALAWLAVAPLPGAQPVAAYAAGLRQLAGGDAAGARAAFERIVAVEPAFARAYYGILLADRRLGGPEQTLAAFQAGRAANPYACYATALALNQAGQSAAAVERVKECADLTPDYAPLYRVLSLAAAASGQLDSAIAWLEPRLAAAPQRGALRYGLGSLHQSVVEGGRPDRLATARTYLEAARSALPGMIEVEDELYFLFDAVDSTVEVEATLLRMKALAEAAGDEDWLVKVHGRLGRSHLNRGDPGRALAELEPYLPAVRTLPFPDLERFYLSSIAQAQFLTGRLAESLATFAEARRQAAASRVHYARSAEARIAGQQAQVHRLMGSLGAAQTALREALALAREARDQAAEAHFLTELAELSLEAGQSSQAAETVRAGMTLARASGFRHVEYRALLEASGPLAALGKPDEALAALRQGLEMAKTAGDDFVAARYLIRLPAALEAAGQFAEAERSLAPALPAAAAMNLPADEALLLQAAGAIELRKGRAAIAAAHYRREAELGARYALPIAVWNANAGLARCLSREGKWTEALAAGAAAIASVEGIRLSLLSAEQRAAFLASRHALYREAVASAIHAGQPERAFELAEQGRARSLLDMMADPAAAMAEPDARRERALLLELSAAQVELLRLTRERQTDAAKVRAAELRLDKLQQEHQTLSWTVRGAAPAGTAAAAVRRALPAGSALLSFQLGERESFAFAVTARGLRVAPLGPAPPILRAAAAFRELVSQPPQRARQAAMASHAAELHRLLIAPVLGFVPGATALIVVPDGALHTLPFEALEPLLRQYTIAYAPAASVWLALQSPHAASAAASRDLLAYGGAAYTGGIADPARGGLGALPGSRAEVERAAQLYPAGRATLRTAAEATESSIKRDFAEGSFDTIHLAVHGLLNESRPRYSALAFSPPADGTDDGLLQSFEIERLRIRANLVVLSACDTARGQTLTGEGVLGLTRAFLSAGARSVVASLWKVDDRATSQLMTAFHANLRRSLPPAEALRQAKLAAIASGTWSHPFYWAGFILTGAGR